MKKAILIILLLPLLLNSCSYGVATPTVKTAPTRTSKLTVTNTLVPSTSTPTFLPLLEEERWELVWQDEFDGQTLDTRKWIAVDNCDDQRNNEQQCYMASSVYVSNGNLLIAATKQATGGFSFISGAVRTGHKFTQAFGRYEFRAKLPVGGDGIWPALWLFSPNQWPPEIDVLEAIDDNMGDIYMNYWWGTENDTQYQQGKASIQNPGSWHIYAMEWENTEIRWYIDEQLVYIYSGSNITDIPMQLYMNIALGGDWPSPVSETTVFPQYMYVDYVRVYKKNMPAVSN